MNILFYTPFNERSRDTESLMQAFVNQGHSVLLLTQAPRGIYHQYSEKLGVKTFTKVIPKNNSIVYFIRHAIFLAVFCKKNKISVLYAHTENSALPAVIAQYFIKAKVFACRHIVDEAYLMGSRKFILLNKIVYTLARHIIVVSHRSKQFMIRTEKIPSKKIQVIYLAYNFELYQKPDPTVVQEIRSRYPSDILLLTACRMMKAKRPEIAVNILQKLRSDGINAKLLLLGSGPMYDEMQALIRSKGLTEHVAFPGFVLNVPDYLGACDILIHPSIQDSSSVIIKEAGLAGKAAVVCSGIGDVDDYLVNDQNAILVPQENTEDKMLEAILQYRNKPEQLNQMGKALHQAVTERFGIEKIIHDYNKIHSQLKN